MESISRWSPGPILFYWDASTSSWYKAEVIIHIENSFLEKKCSNILESNSKNEYCFITLLSIRSAKRWRILEFHAFFMSRGSLQCPSIIIAEIINFQRGQTLIRNPTCPKFEYACQCINFFDFQLFKVQFYQWSVKIVVHGIILVSKYIHWMQLIVYIAEFKLLLKANLRVFW